MNNIDDMPPMCHDCPYWEVCEEPYICPTQYKKKEPNAGGEEKHMGDLISRKDLLESYDKDHQGPPGGARKLIEEAPEEPAIPTKWIYDYLDKLGLDTAERNAVVQMFVAWKKDEEKKV